MHLLQVYAGAEAQAQEAAHVLLGLDSAGVQNDGG